MSCKTNRIAAALMGAMFLFVAGCNTAPEDRAGANTNSGAGENTNAAAGNPTAAAANANTDAAGATTTSFAINEPERYSLKMNVSLEGSADNRQGSVQLEIAFAKLNANRLWTLKVPSINQEVSYLEKPGLKYIVIPSRNQYVEMTADSAGFPMGDVLSPAGMMARLQSRPHESLGSEMINGRPAWKYRFTGSADTGTTAGTAQAESFIYIDKETTLPLRIDLNASTASGATGRGIVETRDLHLNPDPGQFEIPSGFQKVTGEQLKQQVQGFIALVWLLAPYLGQQGVAPPPPATNSNAAAPNANANRR